MKKYIKTKESNKEIKVTLTYQKGGINHWHGTEEKRGYYVGIQPVEVQTMDNGVQIESFMMFSGVKRLVHEVKRQSDKGYNEALAKSEEVEKELIEYICNKNGIELN
jgi:hypothetical protein